MELAEIIIYMFPDQINIYFLQWKSLTGHRPFWHVYCPPLPHKKYV